ncbi:hypothetical protein QFC24_000417 [Naganishia onofrii]|uniref:Uncharacterized protein n=1 Tax=Naganishia onofrii TaxID=1851511 RepID=A0ACC2XVT4_9TREE|nr:hypothetical protein QFC24_000417 [Naganishia onofrii]
MDELDKVIKGSFAQFRKSRTVFNATRTLRLKDVSDRIPGMAVTLMPHQVIGVEWMLNKERETTHPAGILANAMGLGKTVQMIATIVANPRSDKTDNKLTLIVANQMMPLWQLEENSKKGKDKCYDQKKAKASKDLSSLGYPVVQSRTRRSVGDQKSKHSSRARLLADLLRATMGPQRHIDYQHIARHVRILSILCA